MYALPGYPYPGYKWHARQHKKPPRLPASVQLKGCVYPGANGASRMGNGMHSSYAYYHALNHLLLKRRPLICIE
eukprot:2743466-Rhodomonas_salina.1